MDGHSTTQPHQPGVSVFLICFLSLCFCFLLTSLPFLDLLYNCREWYLETKILVLNDHIDIRVGMSSFSFYYIQSTSTYSCFYQNLFNFGFYTTRLFPSFVFSSAKSFNFKYCYLKFHFIPENWQRMKIPLSLSDSTRALKFHTSFKS